MIQALAYQLAQRPREKQALGRSLAPEEQEERKRQQQKATVPWMGLGLGGGAAGLAGLAQMLASGKQIQRIRDAAAAYKPEAFTQGQLPPKHTGLTHYQRLLSPAAQLTPFGIPVGDLLVKLRSDPDIMEALGTRDYTLATPQAQAGVGGNVHYNMFAQGPIPAYMHQLKARLADHPVPETLGVPKGTRYSDWMGRKFEDFVANQTGQRINPFEVTTKFMPHEEQQALMERFHQSHTPQEREFRMKAEDPGPGYANQTSNYLPKATAFADFRDRLKDMSIAGGGAAAGAIGGHMLYDILRDKKDKTKNPWGRRLASLAGAGLGGAGAYFAGTAPGQAMVSKGLTGLKRTALGLPSLPGS